MPRQLTKDERNHARHLLQELSEHAKSVRDAIEPETGVMVVTDVMWKSQWESLTAALDLFTKDVLPKVKGTIAYAAGGNGSPAGGGAGGGAGGDTIVYTSGGRVIGGSGGGGGGRA